MTTSVSAWMGGDAQPTEGNRALYQGIIQRLAEGFSIASVAEFAAPDTVIASSPKNPTYERSAIFTFTGAGNQGKYWCKEYTGTESVFLDCGPSGSGGSGDTGVEDYTGLAPGIHTFEVYAEDKNKVQDPSPAKFIWEIKETVIVNQPLVLTNQTAATFTFTGAGTGGKYWCREYTGTAGTYQDCGTAGSGGSGDIGAKTFSNLPPGSHTFEVYAEDASKNTDIATPASFTWVIDVAPPDTVIATSPKNPTNQTTATFTFTGAGPGGKYRCREYTGSPSTYEDCGAAGSGGSGDTGTKNFTGLSQGIHTFEVYAEDAAGNVEVFAAVFLWAVDITPPDTVIATNPKDPTNQTAANFTFTGAGTDGRYWCREYVGTPGTYQPCGAAGSGGSGDTGAKSFTGLVPGTHTFEVYAEDAAGNGDSTAAKFTWTVDLTAPDTAIGSRPLDPTHETTAVFTFTGAGTGGRYWCRLAIPNAVFEDCGVAGSGGNGDAGAKSFSGLTEGLNTFQVYAEDAAGNVDTTPAQFSWVIDTTPPNTVIASSPKNPTNQTTAVFTFTGAGAGGRYWCREWAVTPGPYENCGTAGSGGLGDMGAKNFSVGNGIHTFDVYAEDAAGNMDASPAQFIWNVNTIRPETVIVSKPADPTSQRAATFTFTGAGTNGKYWCREWTGPTPGSFVDCGASGSGGTGDMGTKTFSSLPDNTHSFEVYAEDEAGNKDESPAQYSWKVDTQAPDTTITSKPPNSSNQTTATFEFSANEPGVGFFCSLDGAAFATCTSPHQLTNLGETPSPHTFRVYATDGAGNSEAETGAASYSWVVDLTSPETTIKTAPSSPTKDPNAVFEFSSNETPVTYQCSLDSAAWASCPTPVTFPGLKDDTHNLCVKAKDVAGNEDGSAACHQWIVDTGKPHTEITSGPSRPTNQAVATFIFDAGESGATYMCSLDSASFAPCISPKVYSGLGETPNPHVFQVYATDSAGNTEGPGGAVSYSWTVDFTPPNPPVIVLPADNQCTNSNTVGVEGSTEAGATVTIYLDGLMDTARTATADGLGKWSVGAPIGTLNDGPHTLTAKAKDLAENTGNLSSTRTFVRDTDPPETWFVEKPPVLSRSSRAVFKFGSDENGVHYECNRYDGNGVFECSNGLELTSLIDGSHTLAVWAVDCAGNADPTPEVYQWTVDTIGPEVIVTSPKEGEAVGNSSPVISGTSEKSATVEIIVDDSDPQTPPVPGKVSVGTDGAWSFTVPVSLPNRDYTVIATATDPAGNIGPKFGPRSFKVDTSPPHTTIIKGPPPIDIHDSTEFSFQSSKGGTLFEYSLDKVPEQESDWLPVTNKYVTPSLKNGKHFLLVRAVDEAGNKDPEPAKAEWEVAAERPPPPEIKAPAPNDEVYSLTPTIVGTAVPNGSVEIFVDWQGVITQDTDAKPKGTVSADEDGNWSYTFSAEAGEHTVVGRAANIYQNKGQPSDPITFKVFEPKPQAKAIGGGLGCDASSSSASSWLALLGLLAFCAHRGRRQRPR
ncbi:Ig-like domain-containing protein [Hyalangium versicolor]|uniref:Ig-like domain-containing protein n=1 Tax=Hyalangium versicolor TaxID=2861190 RepID=UPI001CCBCEEE|nr:Ig-like domain-containing protein [Hyalangium versicolor]